MPPVKKSKKSGWSPDKLNRKQKALIALMPQVESGTLSMQAAMRKAGYSESTAKQQKVVLDHLKNTNAMQDALRKHGVTEEMLAEKIKAGIALPPGKAALGYVQTATELLDAFPAKKSLHGIVDPEELLNQVEQEGSYAAWGAVQGG